MTARIKYIFLIQLIGFFTPHIFGQMDYFSTDTSAFFGVELVSGGDILNSRICKVRRGDEIIEYSPYDIKEYGFKDGRVYISRDIHISDSLRRVFLLRLNKGNANLYYYKSKGFKTYFFEKDSIIFVQMPKRDTNNKSYNELLSVLTYDCSYLGDASNHINYNRRSLRKFIDRYNNCEIRPFPRFRFGPSFGYEFSKIMPNEHNKYLEHFIYKFDGGFSAGMFVDKPILLSDFSLHSEAYFSKHGFSYSKIVENRDIDLVVNLSTFMLPILIRYTYPSNNIRPFIDLGMIWSFHLRNEAYLFETTITENVIEINDVVESSLIEDIQYGYCFGGGIEYILNSKHSLFFELRYNNQYGITNPETIKISGFNLITGINF